MKYQNFYETIDEANLRLQGTIVLYDGEPYYVYAITNHKSDGAFRIYMTPVSEAGKGVVPPPLNQFPSGTNELGQALDACIDAKNSPVPLVRKKMDSSLFNKYRPFPLGMMNYHGNAFFLERRPNRPSTKQGLVPQAIEIVEINCSYKSKKNPNIAYYSAEFRDCVVGDYPSPKECLNGLKGDNLNESAAFHRNFALVRGPIDTLFLAYKTEIVGALPRNDFSIVRLGKDFKHLKEAAQELRLFSTIE